VHACPTRVYEPYHLDRRLIIDRSPTTWAILPCCADNGNRGRVGAEANLEQWLTSLPSVTTGESKFGVTFDWEVAKLGVPGAVIVKNNHTSEFFLKTITLDDVPGRGTVTFVANSWVYPVGKYRYSRVFFSNDVSRRAATRRAPLLTFPTHGRICYSIKSFSIDRFVIYMFICYCYYPAVKFIYFYW
jgi:hypothetical protein